MSYNNEGGLEKTSGDFSSGFRPLGKGAGGSHPDPEIRGRPKNNFVSAQRASVWSKYSGEALP